MYLLSRKTERFKVRIWNEQFKKLKCNMQISAAICQVSTWEGAPGAEESRAAATGFKGSRAQKPPCCIAGIVWKGADQTSQRECCPFQKDHFNYSFWEHFAICRNFPAHCLTVMAWFFVLNCILLNSKTGTLLHLLGCGNKDSSFSGQLWKLPSQWTYYNNKEKKSQTLW